MRAKTVHRISRIALLLLFLGIATFPTIPAQSGRTDASGPADQDEQKPKGGTIEQPGYLEAFEQVDVYANIMGFVAEVGVDIGDRVKKGELLAKLAVPELEKKLEKQKAMVHKAQIGVSQAKLAKLPSYEALREHEELLVKANSVLRACLASVEARQAEILRAKELQEKGVPDKQKVDEVSKRLKAAQAEEQQAKATIGKLQMMIRAAQTHYLILADGVEIAQAELQLAKTEVALVSALLQYTELRAPFDGVVIRRHVSTGTLAGPPSSANFAPLFTLARVDPIRLAVAVPETDAPRVVKGMDASVRFVAIPEKIFKGTVARTSGALDPKNRTLRVEIDLPNPDGRLLSGMYGIVTLTPKAAEPKKK